MNLDPKRWLERDDVPELSELMRAARSRTPDAGHLSQILANVEAAGEAGASTGAGSAGTAAKASALLPKLALVGGGLGAALWLALAESPTTPRMNPQPTLPAQSAASLVAPSAPRTVPSVPIEAPPQRPAPGPRERKTAAAPSAASVPAVSELGLIREARAALRSDPAKALELTRRHAALFAGGSLAQEREVLAIEALVALGQTAAARQRAESFAGNYSSSAYVLRLERSVGPLREERNASEDGLTP